MIRDAQRFAALLGLDWHISPIGYWSPGRAIRFEFWLPGMPGPEILASPQRLGAVMDRMYRQNRKPAGYFV
jgi:hypothetical protein